MIMYDSIRKIAWTKAYADEKLACRRRNCHINSCSVRRKGKLGHGVTEFLAANMEESLADPLRQENN